MQVYLTKAGDMAEDEPLWENAADNWFYDLDRVEVVTCGRLDSSRRPNTNRGAPLVSQASRWFPWGPPHTAISWARNASGKLSRHDCDVDARHMAWEKRRDPQVHLFPQSFYETLLRGDHLFRHGDIFKVHSQDNKRFPWPASLIPVAQLLKERSRVRALMAAMTFGEGDCNSDPRFDQPLDGHVSAPELEWTCPTSVFQRIKSMPFYFSLGLFTGAQVPREWLPAPGDEEKEVDIDMDSDGGHSHDKDSFLRRMRLCYKGVVFIHPGCGMWNPLQGLASLVHLVRNNGFDPSPFPSGDEDLASVSDRLGKQAQTWYRDVKSGRVRQNPALLQMTAFAHLLGRKLVVNRERSDFRAGRIFVHIECEEVPQVEDDFGQYVDWAIPWTEEVEKSGWVPAAVRVLDGPDSPEHSPWWFSEPCVDSFVQVDNIPTLFITHVRVEGEDVPVKQLMPWLRMYGDPYEPMLNGSTLLQPTGEEKHFFAYALNVFVDGFDFVKDSNPACGHPKGIYVEIANTSSQKNELYELGLCPKGMRNWHWGALLEADLVELTFDGIDASFWDPVSQQWRPDGKIYALPMQFSHDLKELPDFTGITTSAGAYKGSRCSTICWNDRDRLRSHGLWDVNAWQARTLLHQTHSVAWRYFWGNWLFLTNTDSWAAYWRELADVCKKIPKEVCRTWCQCAGMVTTQLEKPLPFVVFNVSMASVGDSLHAIMLGLLATSVNCGLRCVPQRHRRRMAQFWESTDKCAGVTVWRAVVEFGGEHNLRLAKKAMKIWSVAWLLILQGLGWGLPPLVHRVIDEHWRILGKLFSPFYSLLDHYEVRQQWVSLERHIDARSRAGDDCAIWLEEKLWATANQKNFLLNHDLSTLHFGTAHSTNLLRFEAFHKESRAFAKHFNPRAMKELMVTSLVRSRQKRLDGFCKMGMRDSHGHFIYGRNYRLASTRLTTGPDRLPDSSLTALFQPSLWHSEFHDSYQNHTVCMTHTAAHARDTDEWTFIRAKAPLAGKQWKQLLRGSGKAVKQDLKSGSKGQLILQHLQVLLEEVNRDYHLDWPKDFLRGAFRDALCEERITTHYIRRSSMKRDTYLDCVLRESDLLWAKSNTQFHVGDIKVAVEFSGLHSCPTQDLGQDLSQYGPDTKTYFVIRPWVDRRDDAPSVRGDLSAYGHASVVMSPTKATRVVLPDEVIQRLLFAHNCVWPPPDVLAKAWGYTTYKPPEPANEESESEDEGEDEGDGDGDVEMKESAPTHEEMDDNGEGDGKEDELVTSQEREDCPADSSMWDNLISQGMSADMELSYALQVELPSDPEQSEYEVSDSEVRAQQREDDMDHSGDDHTTGPSSTPSPAPLATPTPPKKKKSRKPKRGPAAWSRMWAPRKDRAWQLANSRYYAHALAIWCKDRHENPQWFRERSVGPWCGTRWECSDGHGFGQMACKAAGCDGVWRHWHRPTQAFRVFSVYQGALCKFLHGGDVQKYG